MMHFNCPVYIFLKTVCKLAIVSAMTALFDVMYQGYVGFLEKKNPKGIVR